MSLPGRMSPGRRRKPLTSHPCAVSFRNPRPTLPYATKEESELNPEVLINRQIPMILVGAGLAIRFVYAWWAAPSSRALPSVFGEVGLSLMLSTGLALVCVFVASYVRGFKMGSFGEAVLKLMAVAIAPSAAMLLLSMPLYLIPFGFLGVWGIGFCLYFALLGLFFDLDQDDTWLCVILIGRREHSRDSGCATVAMTQTANLAALHHDDGYRMRRKRVVEVGGINRAGRVGKLNRALRSIFCRVVSERAIGHIVVA